MEIERFSLSLSRPLATAAGRIDTREGFLVRVERGGTEGIGEATPLPGWTESLDACETALEAVDDPEAVLEDDVGAGPLSDCPAARHGVALALLDADARAAGEPLYRHLGGDERVERVPTNATVGDAPPAETARTAAAAVDAGHRAVKLKVGTRQLGEDLERFEAVRERCPNVELRADANGAWTPEVARRALSRFEHHDVAFVEQPLSAPGLEEHAELRADADVGVALDESVVDCGVDAVLSAAAADVVVLKPMALGGIDLARTSALRAREAGVEPVVTTTIDGAYARAAAVHLAASIAPISACGLATGDRLTSDLCPDVAPVRAGSTVVPHGKGNIPLA